MLALQLRLRGDTDTWTQVAGQLVAFALFVPALVLCWRGLRLGVAGLVLVLVFADRLPRRRLRPGRDAAALDRHPSLRVGRARSGERHQPVSLHTARSRAGGSPRRGRVAPDQPAALAHGLSARGRGELPRRARHLRRPASLDDVALPGRRGGNGGSARPRPRPHGLAATARAGRRLRVAPARDRRDRGERPRRRASPCSRSPGSSPPGRRAASRSPASRSRSPRS